MTSKEMTELFSVMLLAWPNAEVFKGGIAKLGPTINLWVTCLPEIDFWTGQQTVKKLVRERKFPPTVAEFKAKAETVKNEIRGKISSAWNELYVPMKFGHTIEEAFASLPEWSEARKVVEAMGGPKMLTAEEEHIMGDGSKKIVVCYDFENFKRTYEELIRCRSSGQPKAIGQDIKRIGGKNE